MINRLFLLILLGLLSQTVNAFPITSYLEMVKVSAVGYAWKTVPLSNTYIDPVIACTYNLPSIANNEAAVRVQQVGAGFEVLVQRPLNSNAVTASDVYCTVSEAGSYTYPIKYEAHTVGSSGTNYGSDWSIAQMVNVSAPPFKTQTYDQPVVTGQVMSFNNDSFSVFWSNNCSSRKTPPNDTAICIGKHTGQSTPNTPNTETLGYFIAEEAEYFMANAYVKIALGADAVAGTANTTPYNYTLPRSFSYATATQSAEDGGNGGWAVLYGANPVSNVLALGIEEETVAGDSTRTHTNEQVAYWVSQPITKTIADLRINEVLYQQATGFPEFIELYAHTSGSIVNYVLTSQDGVSQNYLLPDIDVMAGDYIVFYIAAGTNSSAGNVHTLYSQATGSTGPKLADTGDDVVLLKPSATDVTALNGSGVVNAVPVDYVAYSSGSTDPVPVSNDGVTVNWNAANVSNLDNAAGGQSISLTQNAIDSDTSLCWELTTSGQATSCPTYIITSDTDSTAYINSAGQNNNFSPLLTLEKAVQTIYDPVNGDINPKAIPGSILEYTITAYNGGPAPADNNSITITDLVPANTRLCVASVGYCTPPYFVDGMPSSGLLSGTTSYSTDDGNNYGSAPLADGFGGSDAVTHLSMPTTGSFQPISAGSPSNFSVKFRVIVE